jgi:hypothetical protein
MADQKVSKELTTNPTIEVGAGFKLRSRNGELKQSTFTMKDEPELCRILVHLASDEWSPEQIQDIPPHLSERLVELEVMVPKDEIPGEVYFRCSLDQPPLEFVPYECRQLKHAGKDLGEFVVNRGVYVQIGPEPPASLVDRVPFRDKFQPSDPILWVEDPGTKVLAPYWPKAEFIEMIQCLVDGRISPSDLPPRVAESLVYVNVLIPQGYEEARVIEWQGIREHLSAQLKSEQYVVLRNTIHPLQLAALRRYFRTLDQKGGLYRDTIKSINRSYYHNDGVARFMHHQITTLVSQIVPEPIKPSYAFLATYKSGAILKRHTDREQCAWNLSLLVDMNPEMELSDSWPIYLEAREQVREVRLAMGDGVLYRGTDIPHWRDTIPEGHIVTLILCHFVPVDFRGSLH